MKNIKMKTTIICSFFQYNTKPSFKKCIYTGSGRPTF